jgi:hypothetical protein
MNVFAYCAESFAQATQQAAGVEPLTSPPVKAETFDPQWLVGHDLLFIDLHGEPGDAAWYGDYRIPALTATQVRSVDLRGTGVFATSCYLGDADSPMLDALLDAGAAYVIGGDSRNYAGETLMLGASLLGHHFRSWLSLGAGPRKALSLAKQMLKARMGLSIVRRKAQKGQRRHDDVADLDTLEFRMFVRKTRRTNGDSSRA